MAYFEGINNGCDRCSQETRVITGSYFNTEMICMKCDEKERAHPDYKTARNIEVGHVSRGNYNFQGIGKPKDL